MKKGLAALLGVVTFFTLTAVSAEAAERDTLRVGLRYGTSALFSANLENAVGEGYEFGYFENGRDFVALGWTEETCISMTAAGTIYVDEAGNYSSVGGREVMGPWHVQLDGIYDDYDQCAEEAWDLGGWPAYIDGEFVVRFGCYESRGDAQDALEDLGLDGEAVKSSSAGVIVTRTRTTEVLFEFQNGWDLSLGVMPQAGRREEPVTWFKGYKYKGGFEYVRPSGGDLRVINVVDLEDYVKGVVPYEMNGDWPLAALEAQAVCARTFACRNTKHQNYDFDVCSGTCCQVYNGTNTATDLSDEAVENTEGECLYYDGELIEAVYHSSNGGATEDAENVWGGRVPYLLGKEDPYEELTSIPNYNWSVTYTADQLTWILQQKNYTIGDIEDVYVSAVTDMGNVAAVTFVDTDGEILTLKGDTARTVFYSSTYQKSVPSLRFSINGKGGGTVTAGSGGYYVNGAQKLSSLEGAIAIATGGKKSELSDGSWYAITADGVTKLSTGTVSRRVNTSSNGTFTITGSGNGHNVGLSQYGARAMAEDGYDYEEILKFYYTDITIK